MTVGRLRGEAGAIPFVLVGVVALGSVLGAAWAGSEWSQRLLGEAGGELTVWVLRGAFWALDLVALQAATEPVSSDWYSPVLDGPAVPLLVLAGLVVVATLTVETIAGMVQGNTPRIVAAVGRALLAGMLATVGAALLLAVAGGLSEIGRAALEASGSGVDAPLVPLQQVLMDTAQQRDEAGVELFIAFLAGLVIVFTCLSIYFLLAMRPVVLAAIIVLLPVAHAVSVWTPMRRVQLRVWSLAFAVLLADSAILTMFAVANAAMGQPQGVDRLIFGTFGLLLAALSPAALARIVGAPELHGAVQSMSRGSKALTVGAGLAAVHAASSSCRAALASRHQPSPTGSGAGSGSAGALTATTTGGGGDGGDAEGGAGGDAPGGPDGGGNGPTGGTSGAGTGTSGAAAALAGAGAGAAAGANASGGRGSAGSQAAAATTGDASAGGTSASSTAASDAGAGAPTGDATGLGAAAAAGGGRSEAAGAAVGATSGVAAASVASAGQPPASTGPDRVADAGASAPVGDSADRQPTGVLGGTPAGGASASGSVAAGAPALAAGGPSAAVGAGGPDVPAVAAGGPGAPPADAGAAAEPSATATSASPRDAWAASTPAPGEGAASTNGPVPAPPPQSDAGTGNADAPSDAGAGGVPSSAGAGGWRAALASRAGPAGG